MMKKVMGQIIKMRIPANCSSLINCCVFSYFFEILKWDTMFQRFFSHSLKLSLVVMLQNMVSSIWEVILRLLRSSWHLSVWKLSGVSVVSLLSDFVWLEQWDCLTLQHVFPKLRYFCFFFFFFGEKSNF